jgi:endonuclease/exonuclease/phosphatase family metal-dependent hydrolase
MKASKKKSIFFWFMFFMNSIAIAALLVSYLGAWIKPSFYWPIAFFGLAYPFLVITNFLFFIYWVFRKRWFALVPLVSIGIGYNTILDYVQFGNTEIADKENSISIISYNAHLFKPIKTNKYDKKSRHEMLEMLLSEKADILCFQEFYFRKKGAYNIKDSIQKNGDYKYFKQYLFDSTENERMSLAIFSKYKIINFDVLNFHDRPHANMCMYTDVEYKGDTIRIINTHLQSISFQPEDYEYLNQVKNVETDMQSNKRIGARLKKAFLLRGNQAEEVRELIDESPYPVIVSGDFNDTPASYAYNVISNGLKSSFREQGNGVGVTYNGAFPNFQIDYLLCSKEFEVCSYKIIKKKYSDHYPVKAEFKLSK